MSPSNNTSLIDYIQRCLLLATVTLASNLFFSVFLIGELQLLFGTSFVLAAFILLPKPFAFIVLLSSIVSLFIIEQSWLFIAVHILEVCVIAWLLSRQVFVVLASIIFWLVIGMPIIVFSTNYIPSLLSEISVVLTIQQGLNGILNAALAAAMLALLPMHLKPIRDKRKEKSLSQNIFALCASSIVIPLLLVSFLFVSLTSNEYETRLMDKMKSSNIFTSQIINNIISEHKAVIEQHAKLIASGAPLEYVQASMIETQRTYPAFLSLTTADKNGNLLISAPEQQNTEIDRNAAGLRTVESEAYFLNAKETLNTQVSNPHLSKDAIVAPVITIASPVINNEGFSGLIFGAINLDAMSALNPSIKQNLDFDAFIVTDSENLTIYASGELQRTPLSLFLPMPSYHEILSKLPVFTHEGKSYAYFKSQTGNGWNVYVLSETQAFTQALQNNYLKMSLALAIIIPVFLLFAYLLSHQLSAPLVKLLRSEDDANPSTHDRTGSKEFSDVANKLKRTQFLMRNFENRIKQQVNEKTEQLEQLNLQLAAQAREDGMTHLLNRSGFDELAINAIKTSYRLGQPFSLALLDLDHFKQINDNFGHLVGDKCLQAFSALMQRNCKRDTDIIGRYGGEEFIILMSGKNVQAHYQMMENIHQQTRNIALKQNDGESVKFTVSIGICSVLGNVSYELEDIVKLADEQLYKCKGSGRDRISVVTVGYSDMG